jgi:hypothetical protein
MDTDALELTAAQANHELMRRRNSLGGADMQAKQGSSVAHGIGYAETSPVKTLHAGSDEELEAMFTYHEWNPVQRQAGIVVREALVAAAKAIVRNVPPGPDRSVAIRKLREARMDANSAITSGGRF